MISLVLSRQTCWPTPTQELLLKAILCQGEVALEAWAAWHATTVFDDLDYGSSRLIPHLYRNLSDHGLDHPMMPRYKGLYRRFWLSNQLLFKGVQPTIAALHDAGIPVLLMKGGGLVLSQQISYGLRPMDDIDILVDPQRATETIDIIRQQGWYPKVGCVDIDPTLHSLSLLNKVRGREAALDLHWRVLQYELSGQHETGYWARSQPILLDEIPVRAMSTADQLLHTCVHGICWNDIPPLRWITDSMLILESAGTDFDWDHVVTHAEKIQATLHMFHGLNYLKQRLCAPVPAQVLRDLERLPISPQERRFYTITTRKPWPIVGTYLWQFSHYYRAHKQQGYTPSLASYLQERWHVPLWQIPREAIWRVWRKTKKDLSFK